MNIVADAIDAMKTYIVCMLAFCSAASFAQSSNVELSREFIKLQAAQLKQKLTAEIDELAKKNEMLTAKKREFNDQLTWIIPPDTVKRTVPYTTSEGKVLLVEKQVKLSDFSKKLMKVRLLLQNEKCKNIMTAYTTIDPRRVLADLDEALKEAKLQYDTLVADIQDNEKTYAKVAASVAEKRRKGNEDDNAAIVSQIKQLKEENRKCRHDGRIGSLDCRQGCVERMMKIKTLESELNSAKRLSRSESLNDELFVAQNLKTQRSDMRLAETSYISYRNALVNSIWKEVVDGVNSQLDMKIAANSELASKHAAKLEHVSKLCDNLKLVPDGKAIAITSSQIDKMLAVAFDDPKAVEDANWKHARDEERERQEAKQRAREAEEEAKEQAREQIAEKIRKETMAYTLELARIQSRSYHETKTTVVNVMSNEAVKAEMRERER